jgi:hypothetical protein
MCASRSSRTCLKLEVNAIYEAIVFVRQLIPIEITNEEHARLTINNMNRGIG